MTETKVGTLNDSDIRNHCKRGGLIEGCKEENIKQACYELRASNIYYDLNNPDRRLEVPDNSYILIKPKQLVVIMTLESLNMPSDILGRILTKGKLFSIGLLPVNTYADPGFRGKLGIVFSNLSNNYLKIKAGEGIAKIEFCKLENEVSESYSGQHGYQTGIWPIPREMILSNEEIKKDKRIKEMPEEIILSHGENIGKVVERISKYERKLILSSVLYLIFTIVLITCLSKMDWITPLVSIVLGVISNIIFTTLTWLSTNFRR